VSVRSDVIREIDVADVATWLKSDPAPVLLDVRDPDEHATGCIGSALLVPNSFLEARIAELVPDRDAPIVAYCAAGKRSMLAAQALAHMGYRNVSSMRGGFAEWQRAGHRWIVPAPDGEPPPLTAGQAERYARHLRLLPGCSALVPAVSGHRPACTWRQPVSGPWESLMPMSLTSATCNARSFMGATGSVCRR